MNSLICPRIELVQDFIAVLITCKSDVDSIKNEIAILQTTLSGLWGPQGQVTLMLIVESGPLEHVQDLMLMPVDEPGQN